MLLGSHSIKKTRLHIVVLCDVFTKMKKTFKVAGKGKVVCQMYMTMLSCRIQMQRLPLLYVVGPCVYVTIPAAAAFCSWG
jgi:hypothetical protein